MKLAMRKAKTAGIGYVGVRHSSHFGAAGFYAKLAAETISFGMSMSNVDLCTTAPGSKGSVLGTNPIAYAAPLAGEEIPVFLDIATSAVAATKVFAAKALGKNIPDTGWWTTRASRPATRAISAHGVQLPMAGYKGYGLAVMVEILSAVVTGASVTSAVRSWVRDRRTPSTRAMHSSPSIWTRSCRSGSSRAAWTG